MDCLFAIIALLLKINVVVGIHSHDVSFLIITEKILEINNRGDSTIKEEDEEKN